MDHISKLILKVFKQDMVSLTYAPLDYRPLLDMKSYKYSSHKGNATLLMISCPTIINDRYINDTIEKLCSRWNTDQSQHGMIGDGQCMALDF